MRASFDKSALNSAFDPPLDPLAADLGLPKAKDKAKDAKKESIKSSDPKRAGAPFPENKRPDKAGSWSRFKRWEKFAGAAWQKVTALKVSATASKLFQWLSHVLKKFVKKMTPFRYLGSKTWSVPGVVIRLPFALFKRAIKRSPISLKEELFPSGYHFNEKKTLSSEEARPYLPYICAAAVVHTSDPSWIEPLGYQLLKPGELKIQSKKQNCRLQAKENCYFDKKSGLKIALVEKKGTVIVSFGALKSEGSEIFLPAEGAKLKRRAHHNVAHNLLGGVPFIYRQADDFLSQLQKQPDFAGKKIVLVGQCYGGSIASYLALRHDLKAFCFNTLALGAGLQQKIGKDKLLKADDWITHISARHDFVSDCRPARLGDRLLSGMGVKTPGIFGRRYLIPSAYKDGASTHQYILGSMMQHIGYDKRAKPKDIDGLDQIQAQE